MIRRMSHTCFSVLDQERAKRFYTEKLGFEVRSDVTMGPVCEDDETGFRWLTVSPPDQPDIEMGTGVMATDDCQKTYEELSARGVVFTQEPAERPYGVEAVLRDDSDNWFSLTEHTNRVAP